MAPSVAETGKLASGPMEKAKAALRRYTALARQMHVEELDIIATAAAREAENGAEFIADVEKICGGKVKLLSGAEEARISALGIVAGFQNADGVGGDLGGGSLELMEVAGRDIGAGESLLLGSLNLQTASKHSPKAARDIARKALEESKVIGKLAKRTFYAIGGTWRSVARLHMHDRGYPLHVMHEYRIDPDELDEFLKLIARGPLESFPGINVVSKQRQALLPYGAIVLGEVLRAGKPKMVTISALGLREGLLYSKLSAKEQREDPLISAARELSVLRSRSPEHGEELIGWTEGALAAVGVEETAEDKRLRAAACLLADIGWRAHPDYRGEQSLNIISNASFVGVDHPGPRLSGARHLLPACGAFRRRARAGHPRDRADPLPRGGAGAGRRISGGIPGVRGGRGRAAAYIGEARGENADAGPAAQARRPRRPAPGEPTEAVRGARRPVAGDQNRRLAARSANQARRCAVRNQPRCHPRASIARREDPGAVRATLWVLGSRVPRARG